jgi:hypothetical protein
MRWEVIHEPVLGAKFQPGELVSFGVWENPTSGLSAAEIFNSRVDLTTIMPFMVRHIGMVITATQAIHSVTGRPDFRYMVQAVDTGKIYYFVEEELMRG